MTLAQNLSPHEMPFISREYANQLEFQGDYLTALQYFENGLNIEDGMGQVYIVEKIKIFLNHDSCQKRIDLITTLLN